MENMEEVLLQPPSEDYSQDLVSTITKGKRTKRQRPHSPIPFTISPPSTIPSPSTAVSEESTTSEEEDTARCLILLAQGYYPEIRRDSYSKHRPVARGGVCAYTCKTCGKVFSSFQALGGHRASHQKSKFEKKSSSPSLLLMSDEEDFPSPTISPAYKNHRMSLSLQLNNISTAAAFATTKSPSPRIHECSYCGAEFTSGQALGGHMRRHRSSNLSSPLPKPPVSVLASKDLELKLELTKTYQNELSLDLNLPAPEDEILRLGSDSKQQKITEKGSKSKQQNNEQSN